MNIITLDFETYYDKQYSLSKMTTEEYIRDERFEVIGVAVQVNDGEPIWFSGTKEKTKAFLDRFSLHDHIVVAHNAMFDMAILNWHFDIRPKRIVDTLSMARALHTIEVGGSLAALAEYYELGVKGTEVINALGKKRLDFTAEELSRYGDYCGNDVTLTYKLFQTLGADFPLVELKLIDLTIRMFTEPKLELDKLELEGYLVTLKMVRGAYLAEYLREDLMSNPKFADLLRKAGVEPPMKLSPTTGKETYAFSKTDEGFKALAEHPDIKVQTLVAARLGVKSTISETRTQRFLDISARGTLPIPLRYYGAHTGRWAGSELCNMQNIPRGSPLKRAICAPKGYLMCDSDSSQIECRTVAWLAEQNDLTEAFEKGQDVYKLMASAIYGKPVSDISKDERFVGKATVLGCLAEGTLVLCGSGWKPIETVSVHDKVWDGEEWVCHQGLLKKGCKETLNLSGVWLTPDHQVLCGTQWLESQSVVVDENTLYQALGTGAANLPSQVIYQELEKEYMQSSLNANVGYQNILWTNRTSKTLDRHAVACVQKKQHMKKDTGCTLKLCPTTNIGHDYLIDSPPLSLDVITQTLEAISTTEEEVFQSIQNGVMTARRFSDMSRPLKDGIDLSTKWIGLIITKVMSRGISDSLHEGIICETGAALKPSRKLLQTYDLAYAGPRNRFTVLSDRGPLIVHNCGYGMGAVRFREQLKVFKVDMPQEECERIIQVYRTAYPKITALWKQGGEAIKAMMANRSVPFGRDGVLYVEGSKGIRLPNGMYLKYPNLRKQADGKGGVEFVYDVKRGKTTIATRLYSSKLVENAAQALARIIIGEQMLMINKKYPVVMTVHDAIACLIPTDEVKLGMEFVEMCMRLRPLWALDLPLNCEAGYGKNYGEC